MTETIEIELVKSILSGKVKICPGLYGQECMKERRASGHLCRECHRVYMRAYMRKRKGAGKGAKVVNDYDFNQDIYG